MDAIDLKGGRELDCSVAEKVMDIVPLDVRVSGGTNMVRCWTNNPAICDGVWTRRELEMHGQPREYSADVAAAWTVVHKMRHRGFGFVIDDWKDGYRVTFYERKPGCDSDRKSAKATAETLALAICRAALKTIKVINDC